MRCQLNKLFNVSHCATYLDLIQGMSKDQIA
jgi:hypothetical protein